MKSLLVSIIYLVYLSPVWAQDITAIIKEGDRLEYVPNEKASLAKFKEVLKIQPVNIYALNKCSELCSRIGKRQTDPKMIEDYYGAAKTYAAIALKVNPNNAESNCVMAIALGRSSLNRSGKEKINSETKNEIKNEPKPDEIKKTCSIFGFEFPVIVLVGMIITKKKKNLSKKNIIL